MSTSVPLVMGPSGPVPTAAASLLQTLTTQVQSTNPDYTNNLPGALIEDISSTEVAGLMQMDQARVDAVNSVTPYGANASILSQQGVMLGLPQGLSSNTSVYVEFTGSAGYVLPAGFLVSDGTYQYALQDGGVIGTGGTSSPLYAVATQSGTWAVPAGTVTQIITSVPSGYSLTVTNAAAGTPGTGAESVQDYRSRVLQATQVAGQGSPAYAKTLLWATLGVTQRLVSIQQVVGGWEVICGGGDPYAVALAIYKGFIDITGIQGSTTSARNVTVSLIDPPNVYSLVFVNPPQQVVTGTVTWNTTLPNFTAGTQVDQLAAPALVSYINSIIVGQPMNLLEATNAFQTAVASVSPSQYLTTLTFSMLINGVSVSPEAGTSIILSDPESYFYPAANGITVTQG